MVEGIVSEKRRKEGKKIRTCCINGVGTINLFRHVQSIKWIGGKFGDGERKEERNAHGSNNSIVSSTPRI